MIPGVDVHGGYGIIDWSKVAASGVRFAIAKCTEGNEPAKDDGTFNRNITGMRINGIVPGGYHFPYPLPQDGTHAGRSPREQMERYWLKSGGLGSRVGELPPIVDAEWPELGDWSRWGTSAAGISQWLREFCELVAERWARKPLLYTYPFWWRAVSASANVAWAADYGLWMANYTHPEAGTPPDHAGPIVPAPWDNWDIWQYSAKGSLARIPGINAVPVDRDCIKDAKTLARLIGTNAEDTLPGVEVKVPDFDIVHKSPYDDEPPDDAA
jgi:lysozyme